MLCFIFGFWLFSAQPLIAKEFEILTEFDPPYSFKDAEGKPTGFGVEVVMQVQQRIGNNDPIEIVPWARAYRTILKRKNVVVFTMSRIASRESLFQWVGPLIANTWVLVAKKSSNLKIASLEQARSLKSIAVVDGYAWNEYLVKKKFTNLVSLVSHSPGVKMLNAGRVQAIVSSNLSYQAVIANENLDPADFEVILRFEKVEMYIAHSKATDATVVQNWQTAFNRMKEDGSLSKIEQKWFPNAENVTGKVPKP